MHAVRIMEDAQTCVYLRRVDVRAHALMVIIQ